MTGKTKALGVPRAFAGYWKLPTHLVSSSFFLVVTEIVFTNNNVVVRVVNKATMLFANKHEQGWRNTFNVSQVNMDKHEDNEYVHHEVVDDTHRHGATNEVRGCQERSAVCRNRPEAKTSPEHDDDQDRDQEVADLLRNTELSTQWMILL